jgi:hypothetical protein
VHVAAREQYVQSGFLAGNEGGGVIVAAFHALKQGTRVWTLFPSLLLQFRGFIFRARLAHSPSLTLRGYVSLFVKDVQYGPQQIFRFGRHSNPPYKSIKRENRAAFEEAKTVNQLKTEV